jgi:cysteinyl-tRNA synthetase
MALELIRQRFGTEVLDIHAGGVDLIFPHHEDEIAQSCAYTGKDQFARFWLHGEFLGIEGTKMSKRYGNVLTPRDLREEGVPAEAVRLLMFGTHYRKKLDWSDDALAAAREGSHRLGQFQNRLLESRSDSDSPRLIQAAERLGHNMAEALDDDLNAPRALAAMFAFLNEGNAAMDAGEKAGPAVLSAWNKGEKVLGVTSRQIVIKVPTGELTLKGYPPEVLVNVSETPPDDPNEDEQKAWALKWALRRKQAKSARDYAEADRIRGLLQAADWEVRDGRDGSVNVVRIQQAS